MHGCGVLKPNYFKKHHFHLLAVNIPDNFGHGVSTLQTSPMRWRNGTSLRGQVKNIASWNNLALALHRKIIVNSRTLKFSTAGIFHFSDLFQNIFTWKSIQSEKFGCGASILNEKIIFEWSKRMDKVWSTINLRVSVNFILQGWKLLK